MEAASRPVIGAEGAGIALGQGAAEGAGADFFAGVEEGGGQLADGLGFRLGQMQGQPLGGTGADAGQAAQLGNQGADGFGKEHPAACYIPGRLKPCVALPISALEIFLASSRAWLTAVRIEVLQQGGVGGIDGLGINFDGGDRAIAFGHDLDGAAAAAGFDGAGGQLGLGLFDLLLHARSLFHEFSDVWHGVLDCGLRIDRESVERGLRISRTHLHDLAFEYLERLLDQRIVFKVILAGGSRRRILPGRRGGRGPVWAAGAARLGRGGCGRAVGRRGGLHEFHLHIRMTQFRQLGLKEA